MSGKENPAVFTPDNEPYLGLKELRIFDELIVTALKTNTKAAQMSHFLSLTSEQKMAAQVIPQAISISLSIRELIRQGYLFGGNVLVRPLAERASILIYLKNNPEKIQVWERGWQHNEAPSLARMLESFQEEWDVEDQVRGFELTKVMNNLVHGKPAASDFNLIALDAGGVGYSSSKILERPDMCKDLCMQATPWLATVLAMMNAYFPNHEVT